MIIERKYHFYAAHRNKSAGIKCARLHGHTYDIVVHIKIEKLNNGIGILFSDIDQKIEPIIKDYDHYLLLDEKDTLCEILELAEEKFVKLPFETSAENLSIWLFTRIKNETKLPIVKIEFAETKSSNVIYEK